MYKRTSKPPRIEEYTINYLWGMDISSSFDQIDIKRSPDVLNMISDENGSPTKRPGYSELVETLGAGDINGICKYIKSNGDTEKIFAYGTKLYTFTDAGVSTELYSGVADNKIRSFRFNDNLYFQDGTTFLEYDGTTVHTVSSVATVPTLAIGTPPSGGGTLLDSPNLLTPKFKQLFSGDGASTSYQLILTGLDVATLIIIIDSVTLTEGTHFTVNRTNGTVDFTGGTAPHGAPSAATPNNVSIQAEKTIAGNADIINKMTISHIFGGSNDTRVFLSGNSDIKNRDYRSEILDCTYFSDVEYDDVGSSATAIIGYATQYASQIVVKYDEIYLSNLIYENDEFVNKRKPITYDVRATSFDSIAIINGKPIFMTEKGLFEYTGSAVRDERNIKPLSEKVNRSANPEINVNGLLDEGNLDSLIGIDYKNKYYLFNSVTGTVWVYDYMFITDESGVGEFYRLDNMKFSAIQEIDGKLYFGANGAIYTYEDVKGDISYNDDGVAIDAYWTFKLFNFGTDIYLKMLKSLFVKIKKETATSISIYYKTEELGNEFEFFESESFSLFSYGESFSYGETFSYDSNSYPQEIPNKIKLKKILYVQFKFRNNVIGESFGILSTVFKFIYQREVR